MQENEAFLADGNWEPSLFAPPSCFNKVAQRLTEAAGETFVAVKDSDEVAAGASAPEAASEDVTSATTGSPRAPHAWSPCAVAAAACSLLVYVM